MQAQLGAAKADHPNATINGGQAFSGPVAIERKGDHALSVVKLQGVLEHP